MKQIGMVGCEGEEGGGRERLMGMLLLVCKHKQGGAKGGLGAALVCPDVAGCCAWTGAAEVIAVKLQPNGSYQPSPPCLTNPPILFHQSTPPTLLLLPILETYCPNILATPTPPPSLYPPPPPSSLTCATTPPPTSHFTTTLSVSSTRCSVSSLLSPSSTMSPSYRGGSRGASLADTAARAALVMAAAGWPGAAAAWAAAAA